MEPFSHGGCRPLASEADLPRPALALADWPCRTTDRIDSTRVHPPRRDFQRGASPARPDSLCRILQLRAHAPQSRKGCTYRSTGADPRVDHVRPPAVRPTPPIHPGGINGRHSPRGILTWINASIDRTWFFALACGRPDPDERLAVRSGAVAELSEAGSSPGIWAEWWLKPVHKRDRAA